MSLVPGSTNEKARDCGGENAEYDQRDDDRDERGLCNETCRDRRCDLFYHLGCERSVLGICRRCHLVEMSFLLVVFV